MVLESPTYNRLKTCMLRLGPGYQGVASGGAVSRLSGMTQRELDLEPRRASPQERTEEFRSGAGKTTDANCDLLSSSSSDAIAGFTTKNRGVSIHRDDCSNVLSLEDEQPKGLSRCPG